LTQTTENATALKEESIRGERGEKEIGHPPMVLLKRSRKTEEVFGGLAWRHSSRAGIREEMRQLLERFLDLGPNLQISLEEEDVC